MNSVSKTMKNGLKKVFAGISFRNIYLYLALCFQIIMLLFGIVFNGAGVAQDFEIKAQMYTRLNKTMGQTYSLVVPPNSSMSMSYLQDHIRRIEKDPVMKQNCKLFYVNRIIEDSEAIPFVLNYGNIGIGSSIICTVDTIDPSLYFDLEILYGNTISNGGEILLPLDMATHLSKTSDGQPESSLIGKKIMNKNDGSKYTICGIFNDKAEILKRFASSNYIIGSFDDFNRNNINQRLAFTTGSKYLENLYFIYNLSYYINPPNYNRQTIVSLTGDDFDVGGDSEITAKIYGTQKTESNTFSMLVYGFSFVGLNATIVLASMSKRLNKKEILFLSILSFALICLFSGIGFLIDLSVLSNLKLRMNMVSCTSLFVTSLIFFVINLIICSRRQTDIYSGNRSIEFHEIDI